MITLPTMSSEKQLAQIEKQIAAAVDAAHTQCDDETPLVLAVHPRLDWFFKKMDDLPEDADLRGIAGERNIMITEDVPGFRVIICNGNL